MEDTEAEGFTADERAAMKQRAAELRAQRSGGDKRVAGLKAVLERIDTMAEEDRALAQRVHALVSAVAPQLMPRTWYGMPAYANEQGKVVVFFQDAGKFKTRYCTLGFQDAAALDDGPMWPVSFALVRWTPRVESVLRGLVGSAVS